MDGGSDKVVISRLVYFYVSNGSTIPGTIKWSPEQKTHDPFAHHFTQEGFCYLFQKLIDKKIIKDVLVVIESSRHSGSKYLSSNMSILAVPHIDELKPYLREDDIILARGGWRSWFPFLQEWHDLGRWLLFYRAASNRGAWKFWDIVLNDLQTGFAQDKVGRFYYPINKPVDPNLFYPMDEPKIYDLCIGASHIHEKKGQWKIVAVLDSYKKRYGKKLQCVLPGAFRQLRSYEILSDHPDIFMSGMLGKNELRKIYNQSRLFVHCGGAGQNDRGPLEAMSCGTPVMLASEQYHPGWMNSLSTPLSFHISPDEPDIAAQQIHETMKLVKNDNIWRERSVTLAVKTYFEEVNGVDNIIVPQFDRLLSLIAQTPHKKRQEMFDTLLTEN
jgi:Glycosyltransferase